MLKRPRYKVGEKVAFAGKQKVLEGNIIAVAKGIATIRYHGGHETKVSTHFITRACGGEG